VEASNSRHGWRQLGVGISAALAFVVAQLLVRLLAGVPSVVEIAQDRLVLLLPGPLFSFVLDRLLYLGKPLFFAGLLIGLVVVLGGMSVAAIRSREPVLVAAVLWLLSGLVELLVTGQGFFGGRADFAVSALLSFAAYAGVLVLFASQTSRAEPVSRPGGGTRQFLRDRREIVGGGVLFLAAAVLARKVIGTLPTLPPPGGSSSGTDLVTPNATPGEAGSSIQGLPSRVTRPADFYVVSKNLIDPQVDQASWTLTVTGTVDHPRTFTYTQLRALPSVQIQRTLECISNEVGGALMSNGVWTGVKLADLAHLVNPLPLTSLLHFSCSDGYTESMPIERAMDPNSLLAYDLDGAPLPQKHGFPARILGTGTYGMKNPKWVTEIQFARSAAPGFWEQQGWNPDAIIQTMARIDTPTDGSTLAGGKQTIAGVAFAGDRGIQKVEVSSDGGTTWNSAEVIPPVTPNVWSFWQATWQPAKRGSYTLVVRATDGTGKLQTGASSDTFPVGATGYHLIQVVVA
jgi:DMSO/TMAO reductase YedYZ molybdopterin-dependent catalytic subunit